MSVPTIAAEAGPLNGSLGQSQAQALLYAQDLQGLFREERARRLELEQANRQLAAESERRARFVALLAHELRLPLSSLVRYLDLFSSGGFGALRTEQSQAVDILSRRAGHLADLVAELAQHTGAGLEEPTTWPGRLGELPGHLERALAPVRARAEERAIDLRVTACLDRSAAEVDLGLVSLAAAQLADNSVKFGYPGGWASVSVVRSGPRLELVVADDGPGLSANAQARLFQVANDATNLFLRRRNGCGLGLTIVAHAARTLNARLSLDTAPGAGSRIRMSIPLDDEAA